GGGVVVGCGGSFDVGVGVGVVVEVGVGVVVGVDVGVGDGGGVDVGVGVAVVCSVFQKPPFTVNVPPLRVFDPLTSAAVPSTLKLPPVLVPPPPPMTFRSTAPIASGVTSWGTAVTPGWIVRFPFAGVF